MNSEKVKEIKKVLEQNIKTCLLYDFEKNTDCKVFQCKYILDYINELESENERLKEYRKNHSKTIARIRSENTELTDRIAELESELEKEQINNLNCDTELQYKEKRIAELEEYIKGNEQDAKAFVNGWHKDLETELKQFAKKLKEKCEYNRKQYCCSATVGANDIDETLKEVIENV